MNTMISKIQQEGVLVLELKGKLIGEDQTAALLDSIENDLKSVAGKLVFDLSQLQHINSTGINFLVKSLTRSRIHGGDMVISGATGFVKELLDVAKLFEVFTAKENKSEAINYFKEKK